MGMIPVPWFVHGVFCMRLLRSREVQALTGLSSDQLREWTGRRGLIPPDKPAAGKGTQARFAWQTVLVLRVAAQLRTQFHVELKGLGEALAHAQQCLRGRSFIALADHVLVLDATGTIDVVALAALKVHEASLLVVPLDPHLNALAMGLGVDRATPQLPLLHSVSGGGRHGG